MMIPRSIKFKIVSGGITFKLKQGCYRQVHSSNYKQKTFPSYEKNTMMPWNNCTLGEETQSEINGLSWSEQI